MYHHLLCIILEKRLTIIVQAVAIGHMQADTLSLAFLVLHGVLGTLTDSFTLPLADRTSRHSIQGVLRPT